MCALSGFGFDSDAAMKMLDIALADSQFDELSCVDIPAMESPVHLEDPPAMPIPSSRTEKIRVPSRPRNQTRGAAYPFFRFTAIRKESRPMTRKCAASHTGVVPLKSRTSLALTAAPVVVSDHTPENVLAAPRTSDFFR